MTYSNVPTKAALKSINDVSHIPFRLDDLNRPQPAPLRSVGINLTRWSIDQADRNQGHENLWLRAMEWLGLGFDS